MRNFHQTAYFTFKVVIFCRASFFLIIPEIVPNCLDSSIISVFEIPVVFVQVFLLLPWEGKMMLVVKMDLKVFE